jgi:hypothetical protein
VILQPGRWFAAFWRTILPPFSGIQTETGVASEKERVIVYQRLKNIHLK